MDWAMKIATDFESRWGVSYDPYYDPPGDGFTFDADEFAAALRKAKAEGYLIGAKDAGEYFLDQIHKIMAGGEVPSFEELSDNFVARASEIEKGNP